MRAAALPDGKRKRIFSAVKNFAGFQADISPQSPPNSFHSVSKPTLIRNIAHLALRRCRRISAVALDWMT